MLEEFLSTLESDFKAGVVDTLEEQAHTGQRAVQLAGPLIRLNLHSAVDRIAIDLEKLEKEQRQFAERQAGSKELPEEIEAYLNRLILRASEFRSFTQTLKIFATETGVTVTSTDTQTLRSIQYGTTITPRIDIAGIVAQCVNIPGASLGFRVRRDDITIQ